MCKKCGRKMRKNGERNGHQRWRCPVACKHSSYTEGKCISKQKRQAINFLYNFVSTIDEKTGDSIAQTIDNLSHTNFECNEDKNIEVAILKVDKKEKNEGIKEKNIEIPAISYVMYREKDKIKILCLRYVDEIDLRHNNKKISVVIRDTINND